MPMPEPIPPQAGAPASPRRLPQWYLVRTKRHGEVRAEAHLRAKGMEPYLPRTTQWPRPAVGSEIVPLFPGYLFVNADIESSFQDIMYSPGVRDFVRFGFDGPSRVPSDVVGALREREDTRGLVRCGDEALGRQVVIKSGPLRDVLGIVERRISGRERVVLLVELLRRRMRVEVPETEITNR